MTEARHLAAVCTNKREQKERESEREKVVPQPTSCEDIVPQPTSCEEIVPQPRGCEQKLPQPMS